MNDDCQYCHTLGGHVFPCVTTEPVRHETLAGTITVTGGQWVFDDEHARPDDTPAALVTGEPIGLPSLDSMNRNRDPQR